MLTGNREFNGIYEKYKNLVLKVAYIYSGNNYHVAEDIAQDTFLKPHPENGIYLFRQSRGSRGHYTRDFSEIVYRIRQHEEREYPFMAVYHCEKYGIKL